MKERSAQNDNIQGMKLLLCGVLLICTDALGIGRLREPAAPNTDRLHEPAAANTGWLTEPDAMEEYIDDETVASSSTEWKLLLVNPWNRIPEDFSVELAQLNSGGAVEAIDARAYPELLDMMDAMSSEGLSPLICSSYRTMEKQQRLYSNKIEQYLEQGYSQAEAEIEAGKWVAVPGTSEHQLGLAVDITDMRYQLLDEGQALTPVQQWLMDNSYKFGFILRYPSDKSEITGINYEPWHYRYVGKEAAKEIYEKGICLEEYLETLNRS